MNYFWYKASDGTKWTNKTHMELASWILENFQRKEFRKCSKS